MGQGHPYNTHRRNSRNSGSKSAFETARKRNHWMLKYTLLFLSSVLLLSCSVTKTVRPKQQPITKKEIEVKKTSKVVLPVKKVKLTQEQKVKLYLDRFGPIARSEMRQYKIPASITLAQGILESGTGQGTLAKVGNNHFGIKCHQEWRGKKVYHDDDKKNECFRKYKNPIESYKDHSEFLTTRGRYSFLFRLPIKDYVGWSEGLSKAGYATDPKYPEKLIDVIERYNLWKYDGSKKQKTKIKNKKKINDDSNYTVKKGDTLYSISKKHKISVDEIMKKNNLKNNNLIIGQKLKI